MFRFNVRMPSELLSGYSGIRTRIKNMVKTFVLVNCPEDFNDIDSVMDGFSDTIMYVLEERCYHAFQVLGTLNLPDNNMIISQKLTI